MVLLLVALIVVSFTALLSILYAGPRMLLMPRRRTPEFYLQRYGFNHPSQIGLRYVEKTLITIDGYKLKYWVIDDPNCAKKIGSVIYLHGITDSKVSGLNYARELTKLCYKVYLIDMRRHGDSEGEYCTFGYYEKHDVSALIDRIQADAGESAGQELRHHGTDIILIGVSMGAAIAIQTAAIDRRVTRVVAVAPFYDLFSIVLDHEMHRFGIKSKLLLKLVLMRAEKIAKFKTCEVSPADDILKINVPILIVHGTEDKTVRIEYSRRLKELNANARLLVVPNAGHIDVLEKGGKAYLEQLENFIKSA
ncbi:MAG: alpha/beta hydrolase [Candidatus Kryptoniota bacterium]